MLGPWGFLCPLGRSLRAHGHVLHKRMCSGILHMHVHVTGRSCPTGSRSDRSGSNTLLGVIRGNLFWDQIDEGKAGDTPSPAPCCFSRLSGRRPSPAGHPLSGRDGDGATSTASSALRGVSRLQGGGVGERNAGRPPPSTQSPSRAFCWGVGRVTFLPSHRTGLRHRYSPRGKRRRRTNLIAPPPTWRRKRGKWQPGSQARAGGAPCPPRLLGW